MGGASRVSELNHLLQSISSSSSGRTSRPTTTIAVTNAILHTLNAGNLSKAVSILFDSPVPFPYSVYARLFQLSSSTRAIVEARKLESHLVTFSPDPPVFLLNRAIEAYGKCGCVRDARELFDEMPHRNGGSWNAMITAYSKNRYNEEALLLFLRMNRSGVFANEITFAGALGSCAELLSLSLSRQIHSLTLKYGFGNNTILETSLVDVYGKCWVMSDAQRKFDEIRNPNDVSWNVIIRRYLEINNGKEAIVMFFQMFPAAVIPLNFTFSNALVACSCISALREGMQIHGVAIKMCFDVDEVVSCSLIDMYVKCGKLECAFAIFDQPYAKNLISWTSIVWGYAINGKTREARELFNDMPERNLISWNAMLAGYIRSLQWEEALDFLFLMRSVTKDIDHVTIGLILNICAGLSDIEMGKQVHGFVYRRGLFSEPNVSNALLDMYGKCGNLTSARVWFYKMSQLRDIVSWNTLLNSYACHGRSEQALTIFWELQWETQPSKVTFVILLAACANIFALEQGRQSHAFMIRNGYEIDIAVTGALVDMYSKCRIIEYALRVFEGASSRDIVLWNSILLGCCHNQRGSEVFRFFGLMQEASIKPDHVTFQAILMACMYEDLVKLGSQYFQSMSTNYGIIPRLEHYEIMIELFGRTNHMDELEEFVNKMPFEPTIPMITRVLEACRKHRCLRLGKWASERLADLNSSSNLQFEIKILHIDADPRTNLPTAGYMKRVYLINQD
ncbi:Tetratricopeptide-like helical domain containing protein [Parasponia andersonii]|uniref:Tetratricopeptide-like helical domain containing protein n=1 Tax=Parasponia andersonii TaxID=3476 RepID=A0A2P5DNQ5_PARAD|nr:Tetratricopeptide-like helical domain containing protein [Parasponia andersonii]